MGVDSTPLRWPAAWNDPGMLSLLQATAIRNLLVETRDIAEAARRAGFTVFDAPPAGAAVVKGLWPGVRLSRAGGDRAAAGPTGEPWVDSNGWRVRAARALNPGVPVWVDAKPQASRSTIENYVLAFADAAAHGAYWIITLDDQLAADIAAKKPAAISAWKRISEAAAFTGATQPAASDQDQAVIGVLATFSGPKVGFTDEVLNNLARTRQQYFAIASTRITPVRLAALKAVIYTDSAEPDGNTRKCVLDFVNSGGMLITGPSWGTLPKGAAGDRAHPRFAIRTLGEGSIALATTAFADPYMAANDAVTLVSHRHDIVRLFNCGACTPCLTKSALRIVFYSLRPVEDASVWVKGAYRSGRLRLWNQTQAQKAKIESRDSGAEIYLPPVSQYAVIELES